MSCQNLGDYLNEDLFGAELAPFLAHLDECPACQAAVAQQRRLDGLLVKATQTLDEVPRGLVSRIERELQRRRRRRLLAYAAAIPVAASLLWGVLHVWPRPQRPIPELQSAPEIAHLTIAPPVQVSFPNKSKWLLIPEDTGTADVTFVWVFPNQRQVRGSTE